MLRKTIFKRANMNFKLEGIKQPLQEFRDEMDTKLTRMEFEMKELQEKLGNQTESAEKCTDEGQFFKCYS